MAENTVVETEESEEQQVTPWKAHAAKGKSTIDYDKLIRKLLLNNNFFEQIRSVNDIDDDSDVSIQEILVVKELMRHFWKG